MGWLVVLVVLLPWLSAILLTSPVLVLPVTSLQVKESSTGSWTACPRLSSSKDLGDCTVVPPSPLREPSCTGQDSLVCTELLWDSTHTRKTKVSRDSCLPLSLPLQPVLSSFHSTIPSTPFDEDSCLSPRNLPLNERTNLVLTVVSKSSRKKV